MPDPTPTIRSRGDMTTLDVEISGKTRRVTISREAIEDYLNLPPERAAAMTDKQREIFVLSNLARITSAAERKMEASNRTADLIPIFTGEL